MNLQSLKKDLHHLASTEKAKILQGFFKTGQGQYGHGDQFLGITVPEIRKIAQHYKTLAKKDIETLIQSNWHEKRLLGIFLLRHRYEKNSLQEKKEWADFYLSNRQYINNWDLVDSSAPYILGDYCYKNPEAKIHLEDLVASVNLWDRRIAILSTFYFIRKNEYHDALRFSEKLLQDKEDLIHKAVGWMLREIGKRDQATEENFLKKHYKKMPRTMLRYAIEKFDEPKRRFYLAKNTRVVA